MRLRLHPSLYIFPTVCLSLKLDPQGFLFLSGCSPTVARAASLWVARSTERQSLLRPAGESSSELSLRFIFPTLSIPSQKVFFSCRLLSDSGKSGKTVGSLVYWITVCTNTSMESFLMAHGYLHREGLPRSNQEAATHKMLIDMADIVRWVFRCRVSSSWQVNVPV
jgi:hypothetical protein